MDGKIILRNAIDDHNKQEKMIRESGCDWVIIRPPRLIDTEKTETYRIAEESEPFFSESSFSSGCCTFHH